jgi:6-pyruvoyl-tetrahydropterin synthase
VRENYFKWIFQQLTDIHDVEDKDVEEFQLEYNEDIYSNLPKTLVCTHKDISRFPFKNCEIDYGESSPVATSKNTEEEEGEDEDEEEDSYCSANSVDRPVTKIPNPADDCDSQQGTGGKKFFLVYKNVDHRRFNEIRENQRKELESTIARTRVQYKDILESLKDTIQKIREVKKTLHETDPMYKAAIAEAKKNLRLFKDPYEEDSEGPLRKKRRRSIENQTRFSDSKVTFFSKANEDMKQEEQHGVRKSWESLYKETWNKHLMVPKGPVIDIPIPQVNSIIRDMEDDVNQLLADCAGMVEEV